MNSQKAGNTLNLAFDATFREREASMNLNVGYEKETQRWNLIIRYFGEASELETDGIFITPLLGNYGIADIPQNRIERFAQNPAVEYIEAPKRLYFAAYEGRQVSCVNPVQNQSPYLFGKGILIACIDSGVDYTHPDGIRRSRAIRPKDIGLAVNIRRSRLIGHWKQIRCQRGRHWFRTEIRVVTGRLCWGLQREMAEKVRGRSAA